MTTQQDYRLTASDEAAILAAAAQAARDGFTWAAGGRWHAIRSIQCSEWDLRDCELEWIDRHARAAHTAASEVLAG